MGQGDGLRLWLLSNSLLLEMGLIWIASWLDQTVTGWRVYKADQIQRKECTVGWLGYVGTANFWEATLQNWQSLQPKSVGAPHHTTAEKRCPTRR